MRLAAKAGIIPTPAELARPGVGCFSPRPVPAQCIGLCLSFPMSGCRQPLPLPAPGWWGCGWGSLSSPVPQPRAGAAGLWLRAGGRILPGQGRCIPGAGDRGAEHTAGFVCWETITGGGQGLVLLTEQHPRAGPSPGQGSSRLGPPPVPERCGV